MQARLVREGIQRQRVASNAAAATAAAEATEGRLSRAGRSARINVMYHVAHHKGAFLGPGPSYAHKVPSAVCWQSVGELFRYYEYAGQHSMYAMFLAP